MRNILKIILCLLIINTSIINVFALNHDFIINEEIPIYEIEDSNNISTFAYNTNSSVALYGFKNYLYMYFYKLFGFNLIEDQFFNTYNTYNQNSLYKLSAGIFNNSDIIDIDRIYNDYNSNGTVSVTEDEFINIYDNLCQIFCPYVNQNDNTFEMFLDGEFDVPFELSRYSFSIYGAKLTQTGTKSTYNGYDIIKDSRVSLGTMKYYVEFQPILLINGAQSYITYYTVWLPTQVINGDIDTTYNYIRGLDEPALKNNSNTSVSYNQFLKIVYQPNKTNYFTQFAIPFTNDLKLDYHYENLSGNAITEYITPFYQGTNALNNDGGDITETSSSVNVLAIYGNERFAPFTGYSTQGVANAYSLPVNDSNYSQVYDILHGYGTKSYFGDLNGRGQSVDDVLAMNFTIENFNEYGSTFCDMTEGEILQFFEPAFNNGSYSLQGYTFNDYKNGVNSSSTGYLASKTGSELSGLPQTSFDDLNLPNDDNLENDEEESGEGEMGPASAFLKSIGEAIKDGLGSVGDTLKNGYESVKETVTNVADNIKDLPNNLWNSVKEGYTWIKDGLTNIGETISNLPSTLWNLIKDGFSWITEQLSNIWNAITTLPTTLWNLMQDGFTWVTEQLSNIWQAITDLPNTIWELLQDGYNWIKEAIESVTTALGNLATWLWEKFKLGFEWIADGLENIWNAILSIPQTIWEFFKTGFEWISEKLGQIWEAITNIATQFIDTIVSAFSILFIPNDGFFENKIEELKSLLEQKIPLSLFTGYYDALFNTPVYYSNKVPNDITMTMPMALGGMTLTVLSFEWFAPYHSTFIQFQTFTIWLLFGMAMLTKIRKLVSNK